MFRRAVAEKEAVELGLGQSFGSALVFHHNIILENMYQCFSYTRVTAEAAREAADNSDSSSSSSESDESADSSSSEEQLRLPGQDDDATAVALPKAKAKGKKGCRAGPRAPKKAKVGTDLTPPRRLSSASAPSVVDLGSRAESTVGGDGEISVAGGRGGVTRKKSKEEWDADLSVKNLFLNNQSLERGSHVVYQAGVRSGASGKSLWFHV